MEVVSSIAYSLYQDKINTIITSFHNSYMANSHKIVPTFLNHRLDRSFVLSSAAQPLPPSQTRPASRLHDHSIPVHQSALSNYSTPQEHSPGLPRQPFIAASSRTPLPLVVHKICRKLLVLAETPLLRSATAAAMTSGTARARQME